MHYFNLLLTPILPCNIDLAKSNIDPRVSNIAFDNSKPDPGDCNIAFMNFNIAFENFNIAFENFQLCFCK